MRVRDKRRGRRGEERPELVISHSGTSALALSDIKCNADSAKAVSTLCTKFTTAVEVENVQSTTTTQYRDEASDRYCVQTTTFILHSIV